MRDPFRSGFHAMKSIAFYSMKGGVGKTTLAVLYAAHRAGQNSGRVLLIDLDPQGAAGWFFGNAPGPDHRTPEFRKKGFDPVWVAGAIRATDHPSLDVLPSGLGWGALDVSLSGIKKPRKALLRLLGIFCAAYETVIFDCPPGPGLVAENIFRAARKVVVPVVPTPLAARTLESVAGFFSTEELSAGRLLPVFSMVRSRLRLHRELLPALRERFPAFAKSEIPFLSRIEQLAETKELQTFLHNPGRTAMPVLRLLWELDNALSAPGTPPADREP